MRARRTSRRRSCGRISRRKRLAASAARWSSRAAEHPQQPAVVGAQRVDLVARLLAPVVLAQRALVLREAARSCARSSSDARVPRARASSRPRTRACERRPARVLAAPARARRQPHGEGLGEVLGRVALRVPVAEVQHVVAAAGARRVAARIAARGLAEDLAPRLAPAQPKAVSIAWPVSWRRMRISHLSLPPSTSCMKRRSSRISRGCAR